MPPHTGPGNYGSGDGKKVARQSVTAQYDVDETSLIASQTACENRSANQMTTSPGPNGWGLEANEVAFTLRDGGGGVRTALNGLDKELAAFHSDPEVIRILLSELVQPLGIVYEAPQDGSAAVRKVTLKVGGTTPQSAPEGYNFGDAIDGESLNITQGNRVVYDVPNLKKPMLGSSAYKNKIMMVPRAINPKSTAKRALTVIATYNHDPQTFRASLASYASVSNSWSNLAESYTKSHKVSFLMGLNAFLKAGIVSVNGAANGLDPAADSEDTVARIAEYIGLLGPSLASQSLSAAQTKKWRELEYKLRHVMLPTPNPKSSKYNVANEFAFSENANGTWESKARVTNSGAPKSDQLGKLLELSLSHHIEALAHLTVACNSEERLVGGVATSTPSTSIHRTFDLLMQWRGGLKPMN